jgi:class 3 adenylate cyclase/alpha-beta hydrolase superfamily lysophospholipase
VERPKTQYAKSGDLHVAYQTLGQGPPDIVFVAPYITHVEAMWEIPQLARYLEGLARIGRLLLFDAVGSGLSDPLPGRTRTLDSWTNDVRAVMDAVGLTRGAIHGTDSAGAMAMLFAATYPERVSSLILVNTFAKVFRADDYPAGEPEDRREGFVDWWHPQWGKGTLLRWYAPSAEVSEEDIERSARLERQIASPGTALTHMNLILDMDVREALPLIQAPTLVVHRRDNQVIGVAHARYLAEHIPRAKYAELPGDEHLLWWGDSDALLGEIREFLTGVRQAPVTNRALATILFTDIVGSTEQAAKLGDRHWRELLDRHDEVLRDAVGRFQGRLVKTTGDGGLATFDGPTRAIEAARAIAHRTRALHLDIRAGLHTGECELRGEDVGGIAVHIASRIAGLAAGGELLVSRTVKDLVVGSGIAFVDRGVHTLKGVPDEWHLFSVTQ